MWRGSIDIMQISGHTNVAFINNYSTLSEERHKKISNILSNTESETNRNAFQQTYLLKPPQIQQPLFNLFLKLVQINYVFCDNASI
jgi:iron only hydrogenase large subunit-like protein